MLRGHCEDAAVFDAFAGTGALGLEAVSRGAARCVFVERSREIADILQRNIDTLGAADRCEVVIGDALGPGALSRAPRPLTLAFFDPPYPVVRDSMGWKRVKAQFERIVGLLTPDGFAILRTPWPFLLDAPPAASPEETAESAETSEPRRRRKGKRREQSEDEWTSDAATIKEWSKAAPETEDGDPPVIGAETAAPVPERLPGDLEIASAIGPETHVYGGTAVHLYMRKPAPVNAAP
jgi:hypothetical protein